MAPNMLGSAPSPITMRPTKTSPIAPAAIEIQRIAPLTTMPVRIASMLKKTKATSAKIE